MALGEYGFIYGFAAAGSAGAMASRIFDFCWPITRATVLALGLMSQVSMARPVEGRFRCSLSGTGLQGGVSAAVKRRSRMNLFIDTTGRMAALNDINGRMALDPDGSFEI